MDYTTLSLEETAGALDEVARQLEGGFATFSEVQLNWRPDSTSWSVAQCLEHLLTSNRLMVDQARRALDHPPTTILQRLPGLPGVLGRMLIRSQQPSATRKVRTSARMEPSSSTIPADVVQRLAAQHREMAAWVRTLDESRAASARMVSPFLSVIVYSVRDGLRLIVAHDHRHLAQAGRLTQHPAFPA